MSPKRVDPPHSITAVLDAALKAVSQDKRFTGVPNGRVEVAWRQPSKGRNGEGDRPERYFVSFECYFGNSTATPNIQRAAQRTPRRRRY